MGYFEETIEKLRGIIGELHSCVGDVGAYTDLGSEIERACSNLNHAVDKYEKQVNENK